MDGDGMRYGIFKAAFDDYEQKRLDKFRAVQLNNIKKIAEADNQHFEPGERVCYLALNEKDWIDATVVDEVWRQGHFYGVLLEHKDGATNLHKDHDAFTKRTTNQAQKEYV